MRILWASDDPAAPTGFGTITARLCSGLAELGHDVSIIGGRKSNRSVRRHGMTIFGGDGRDPAEHFLLTLLRRLQPDVLVTVVEPGEAISVTARAITEFRRSARIVWAMYCPIDCDTGSGRLPAKIVNFLRQPELLVITSRYGCRVARASDLSPFYIPVGVDTRLFRPARNSARRALGYRDCFVVLCDARNQIRKLLPRTLEIFRRFAAGKDDVRLHLHCDPYDPAARMPDYCYDLLADVQLLGVADKVRFSRGMSIHKGIKVSQLASLYQAADVHLLTSYAEGFGMPTLQAAAAGCIPLATGYAANRELVRGHGYALPVRRFMRLNRTWNSAFVDIDEAVARLQQLYEDTGLRGRKSQAARKFAKQYDWKLVVRQWHQLLEREVAQVCSRMAGNATPRSLGQARRAASGPGHLANSHGLSIPVALPPADAKVCDQRVVGRVCLASAADISVFRELRKVFPGLTAWSPVRLNRESKTHRRSRWPTVPVRFERFEHYLHTSVLAIDLGSTMEALPALTAKCAVPLIGLVRDRHQERLWPSLSLQRPNVMLAALMARSVLTDQVAAMDACRLAEHRSRQHPPHSSQPLNRACGSRLFPVTPNASTAVRVCRYGAICYPRGDVYIGRSLKLYGEFSQLELDLLLRLLRRGDVVIDAGANVGTHTLAFAETIGGIGVVHAFEPQPYIHGLLRQNIALNRLNNVRLYQAALGQQPGFTTVPVLNGNGKHNFGGVTLTGGTNGEIVPMICVDDLALRRCHLIKVDVEGMETEVLHGAVRTIAQCRPLLYIENDRPMFSARLIRFVRRLGYRPHWHLPPLFNPDNFAGNRRNVFAGIVSANMLCLPAEMKTRRSDFRDILQSV